jgi:Trk-type K+ transport system membrane component
VCSTVGTVRVLFIALMVVGGIGFVTMLVYVLWQ